jgi:hypothetical protein
MSELAASPVPFRTLYAPAGTVGMGNGAVGSSLGFHVGVGVGGVATDMIDFLTFVGGTSEDVTIGGLTVSRIVPLKHPYFPAMVAVGARAEGTGRGIDAEPGWTDWRILVDFAVIPYAFGGDTPYLTVRRNYGASAITLPGRAYAVSGTPLNHDVAVMVPEVSYNVTKYNVPTMDDSVYKTLAGKVNSDVFLGYAAETVRFDGVQDEISQTIAFTTNRTVSLAVAWRPRSWNQILLPSGVWATPVNVSDGSKMYTPAPFAPLMY